MTTAKLCKDCKHCKADWILWPVGSGYRFAKCNHPVLTELDVVTGKLEWHYCSTARNFRGLCGEEGIYWEPKK